MPLGMQTLVGWKRPGAIASLCSADRSSVSDTQSPEVVISLKLLSQVRRITAIRLKPSAPIHADNFHADVIAVHLHQ